jgi:mono/diheme cytochrome c family protein
MIMRTANRWVTAAVLAAVMSMPAVVHAEDDLKNPFVGNMDAIRQGGALFGENCQQCHNSHGKGGKGPTLIRKAWAPGGGNTDGTMYRTIMSGRPNTEMGSFAMILSSDDVWKIVAYLREEARRAKIADDRDDDDD